jgi:hypothetical protein
VVDVVTVPDTHVTARKATAAVAMLQRSTDRWRNRPGPRGHFHHPTVPGVLHHHAAGVTRQAPGRFRGNVLATFQHRLPGRLGVREHRHVHVHHHLISLPRRAGIDPVVQGRLGEQPHRVGLLLFQGRRFVSDITRAGVVEASGLLLVQSLARSRQGLQEQLPDLGLEPAVDGHHSVVIPVDAERAKFVAMRGLARLGDAIHSSPASHDALDVLRGAGAAHR